jgi:hypothetical protein
LAKPKGKQVMAQKSRPPKQGMERSKSRTFRARGDLDERLVAAATQSGRSVNEEIEYRLDRSFRDEEIREQAFERAWVMFEKKKALANLEAALADAKALGADAAVHDDEEPQNPDRSGDTLKDIVQHAPNKGDKL